MVENEIQAILQYWLIKLNNSYNLKYFHQTRIET